MKKTMMAVVLGVLWSSAAFAGDLTLQGGYQSFQNENYSDAEQVVARYEMPIAGELSWAVEGSYHGKSDHHGLGWLNGYGGGADLIFRPVVSDRFKPYVLGGVGWYWWNFRESSEVQDRLITIDTGDALGYKLAAGFDIPLNERWDLNFEVGYFQSDVPVDAVDHTTNTKSSGLGGDTVGQEEVNVMVGLKYKTDFLL